MNELNKNIKIGLVLSGGGARGAYEVGVLKAMDKRGIIPSVISGASIGALNGAVLASAKDFSSGVKFLELLWKGIKKEDVLKLNQSKAFYWEMTGLNKLEKTLPDIFSGLYMNSIKILPKEKRKESLLFKSFLDSAPLEKIVDNSVDFEQLLSGKEPIFYASVCEVKNAFFGESEFLKISEYDQTTAKKIVVASASLPIAYTPMFINNKQYLDGGMGGINKAQGNTPVEPLIKEKCSHAIVVMLSNGSLWNRRDFDLTTIEIRPSIDIEEDGWIKSLIDFSPITIEKLIAQGEQDADIIFNDIFGMIKSIEQHKESVNTLIKDVKKLTKKNQVYDSVLDSVKNKIN